MKWIFLIAPLLCMAAEKGESIKNNTAKEMLCIAQYPSIYGEKEINGQKRSVEIESAKEVIKIIQPNESFSKERQGYVNCYNELGYIKSYDSGSIDMSNENRMWGHLTNHNIYDPTQYENKTIYDVGKVLGIAQKCGNYEDGLYCNQGFGLDILYDKNKRVKSIFLYGNALQNNKLPFKADSIFQIRNNEGPLGLWVMKNYHKLFSKKPVIESKNLIMWENLTPHIQRVIMTPQNGYFELSTTVKNNANLFRDHWKDTDKATEYLQAIEIQYR